MKKLTAFVELEFAIRGAVEMRIGFLNRPYSSSKKYLRRHSQPRQEVRQPWLPG
jgi:hypothetical protein